MWFYGAMDLFALIKEVGPPARIMTPNSMMRRPEKIRLIKYLALNQPTRNWQHEFINSFYIMTPAIVLTTVIN